MRTQRTIGTWKKPVELRELADRIEGALYWQNVGQKAYEQVQIENNTVPQYVSQTGSKRETQIGRTIQERTAGRPMTWDERSALQQKEIAEQVALDKKREEEIKNRVLLRLQNELSELAIN